MMSTTNWHLPTALTMTEHQRHLPSASTHIEPHAAIAVDLEQPLGEFRAEWGTLCSREFGGIGLSIQFSSVQSLSRVWLFATPWIAARQASLSITNSWNSLKLMSVESVMPSSHLILCHLLILLAQFLPASGSFPMSQLFSCGSQILEFQLQHQSFQWTLRTDLL